MDCHMCWYLVSCSMLRKGPASLWTSRASLLWWVSWTSAFMPLREIFWKCVVDWWENIQESLIFPAENGFSSSWFSLKPLLVEMKSTIKASRETPFSDRVHCLPFSLNFFSSSTWHSKIPQINNDSAFLQSRDMLQNFASFIALVLLRLPAQLLATAAQHWNSVPTKPGAN